MLEIDFTEARRGKTSGKRDLFPRHCRPSSQNSRASDRRGNSSVSERDAGLNFGRAGRLSEDFTALLESAGSPNVARGRNSRSSVLSVVSITKGSMPLNLQTNDMDVRQQTASSCGANGLGTKSRRTGLDKICSKADSSISEFNRFTRRMDDTSAKSLIVPCSMTSVPTSQVHLPGVYPQGDALLTSACSSHPLYSLASSRSLSGSFRDGMSGDTGHGVTMPGSMTHTAQPTSQISPMRSPVRGRLGLHPQGELSAPTSMYSDVRGRDADRQILSRSREAVDRSAERWANVAATAAPGPRTSRQGRLSTSTARQASSPCRDFLAQPRQGPTGTSAHRQALSPCRDFQAQPRQGPTGTSAHRHASSPCRDFLDRPRQGPAGTSAIRHSSSPCRDYQVQPRQGPAGTSAIRHASSPCRDFQAQPRQGPSSTSSIRHASSPYRDYQIPPRQFASHSPHSHRPMGSRCTSSLDISSARALSPRPYARRDHLSFVAVTPYSQPASSTHLNSLPDIAHIPRLLNSSPRFQAPPLDLVVDVTTIKFSPELAFRQAQVVLSRCFALIQVSVKLESKLVGRGQTEVVFASRNPFATSKVALQAQDKIMLTLTQPVDVDRVVVHCRGSANTIILSDDDVQFVDQFGVRRHKRQEVEFKYDMTIQAKGETRVEKKDAVWLHLDFSINGQLW